VGRSSNTDYRRIDYGFFFRFYERLQSAQKIIKDNEILLQGEEESLVQATGCLENPWLLLHYILAKAGVYEPELEIDEANAFIIWIAEENARQKAKWEE